VSWKDVAARMLESSGARVEEDQRGLRVTISDASLLVLLRRLQMSLDRKIEVIGIFEVEADCRPLGDALRRMLSWSFEVELKGLVRKSFVWKPWRELRMLEPVVGSLDYDPSLASNLKGHASLIESLHAASPNLIEVFPELLPTSFMETFLVASGAPMSAYITTLIKEHVQEPGRLAWCYRAQFLYGSPKMPQKIVKNCQLAALFKRVLSEATTKLLQCSASSPARVGSST